MSVQPTAGVKTGDEFVDNVASGDGEEMTPPHPHPEGPTSGESMRALLMGKPNRNSVRNMNSLVRSGVGHPRSCYHLNMSAINEGDEGEDGGIEGPDADDASPKKKKSCCTSFCGVMDDHFVTFILASAAIGIGLGIGLSLWNPEDYADKATAILWIGLLGDLFIRALKCIVLPLVFVSIAVSVMDMVSSRYKYMMCLYFFFE